MKYISTKNGKRNFSLNTISKKNASQKDFFVLFTTTEIATKKLRVCRSTNWHKYFGPYAGRTHAYADVGSLNINTANYRDLLQMYGIGPKRTKIS